MFSQPKQAGMPAGGPAPIEVADKVSERQLSELSPKAKRGCFLNRNKRGRRQAAPRRLRLRIEYASVSSVSCRRRRSEDVSQPKQAGTPAGGPAPIEVAGEALMTSGGGNFIRAELNRKGVSSPVESYDH